MVKLVKLMSENETVKRAEIVLAQNGTVQLYVNDVLREKYLNLESCLYNNKFFENVLVLDFKVDELLVN